MPSSRDSRNYWSLEKGEEGAQAKKVQGLVRKFWKLYFLGTSEVSRKGSQ